MWNIMWLDIDSSLQTNDSKWFDSFCDSTLTRLNQVMTLTRLKKFLDDSDSTLTRRACDSDSTKMTRAHHCSRAISILPSGAKKNGNETILPIWLLFCRWFGYYFASVWKIDTTSIACECSCTLCPNFENFCPINGQLFSVGGATASPLSPCHMLMTESICLKFKKITVQEGVHASQFQLTLFDSLPIFIFAFNLIFQLKCITFANNLLTSRGFTIFINRFFCFQWPSYLF